MRFDKGNCRKKRVFSQPDVPTLVAVACDLRLNLTNTNQIVADSGFSEGKTKPKPLLQTCVTSSFY